MLSVTNCKLKLLLIIRRKALGEADQTEAAVEFLRDEVTSIFHKEERVTFVLCSERKGEFLRDEVPSIFHKEERVSFVVKRGV